MRSFHYTIGISTTYANLLNCVTQKTERKIFCLLADGSITHIYTPAISLVEPYFDQFLWNDETDKEIDCNDPSARLEAIDRFRKSLIEEDKLNLPIFITASPRDTTTSIPVAENSRFSTVFTPMTLPSSASSDIIMVAVRSPMSSRVLTKLIRLASQLDLPEEDYHIVHAIVPCDLYHSSQ